MNLITGTGQNLFRHLALYAKLSRKPRLVYPRYLVYTNLNVP
jgi:hypothetical protein